MTPKKLKAVLAALRKVAKSHGFAFTDAHMLGTLYVGKVPKPRGL